MYLSENREPTSSRSSPSMVPRERTEYLWKRVRQLGISLGKLSKMSNDIQLLGSTRKVYTTKQGKRRSLSFIESEVGRCILTPKNKFRKSWSLVIIFLLFYTAVVTPYIIAFSDDSEKVVWFYTGFIVDFLFFVDIFVSFCSCYYNCEGELVTERHLIIKNYLTGWFLLDLVACVPLSLIFADPDSSEDYNKLLRLLKLPGLYRLLRVFKFLKSSNRYKRTPLLFLLNMNKGVLRLIKFNFSVMILLHLVGCLWYFTAKLDHFDINTWVSRYGFQDADSYSLYITSIYWVFTTLTTVGYGDIVPYTMTERLFTIVLMIFGVGFYSYTISNLSSIIDELDTKHANLKAKLMTLQQLAKITKLPYELKNEIKHHIRLNDKNKRHIWQSHESLMNEVPSSLRTEVSLYIYHSVVEKIYFMQDKDPGFISYIAPKLKQVQLKPGEILFKEFEYPEEVYFISDGRINLLAENSVNFKSYNQGSYFGEDDIIEGRLRDHTAKAGNGGANLLVLSRNHFLKMLEEFPKIAEEFLETAKTKATKNQFGKKSALRFSILGRRRNSVEVKLPHFDVPRCHKKRKIVHKKKEINRQMWKSVGQNSPPQESKWDMVINMLLKNKKPPQPVIEGESKVGLVQKVLDYYPRKGTHSKWTVLRNKKDQLLKISSHIKDRERDNSIDSHAFSINSFVDEAKVSSPLNPKKSKLERTRDQLLLMQFLRSHLSQHNMKLTLNLNIIRSSLLTLQKRHHKVEADIYKLRAYI